MKNLQKQLAEVGLAVAEFGAAFKMPDWPATKEEWGRRRRAEIDPALQEQCYRLGVELRAFFAAGAWHRARFFGGEPCTSFEQACRARFGVSASKAYTLMDAVELGPEAFRRYGWSKLMVLVRAPRDRWPVLLELLEQGIGRRQFQCAVTECKARQHALGRKRSTGRRPTPYYITTGAAAMAPAAPRMRFEEAGEP